MLLVVVCVFLVLQATEGQVDPCGEDQPQVLLASQNPLLFSPGFSGLENNTYPPDQSCSWQLVNDLNNATELKFGNFSVEECTNCKCDYVEAFNDEVSLGRYCGFGRRALPPTLEIAPGEQRLVNFVTDSTGEYSGFIGRFGVPRDTETACSAVDQPLVITDGSSTFYTPNWPQAYPTNTNCRWLFQGQPGSTWTLAFSQFIIEGSCGDYDYVRIYDGPTITSPVYGSFFGLMNPPTFTSRGPEVLVEFESDVSAPGFGFYAAYTYNSAPDEANQE